MGKHKKKRKPFEGWNAIPTTILGYNGNRLPSYKILYCPEYEEQKT